MAKINNDTLAGLIMLAYSLVHVFYLTPDQVELHQKDVLLAMSPRLFCYVTGGTLAFLSAILVFISLSPKSQAAAAKAPASSWQPLNRGLFCTAVACAYAALAGVLGLFVSTAIIMIALLFFFGVRNWFGILLFQVVILGSLYLFFVKALKVVMPDGLLF